MFEAIEYGNRSFGDNAIGDTFNGRAAVECDGNPLFVCRDLKAAQVLADKLNDVLNHPLNKDLLATE